jgi:hypothetical protein
MTFMVACSNSKRIQGRHFGNRTLVDSQTLCTDAIAEHQRRAGLMWGRSAPWFRIRCILIDSGPVERRPHSWHSSSRPGERSLWTVSSLQKGSGASSNRAKLSTRSFLSVSIRESRPLWLRTRCDFAISFSRSRNDIRSSIVLRNHLALSLSVSSFPGWHMCQCISLMTNLTSELLLCRCDK